MTLITIILILPLLAIATQIVLPLTAVKLKSFLQTTFSMIWLLLAICLFRNLQGILVIKVGGWVPPFGISLVFDKLTALMFCVFAIMAFCINCYSLQDATMIKDRHIFFVGFWLLLLAALGTLATADIFNLYVWFELMLVSAFILLSTIRDGQYEIIVHYAIINILGTLFMLLGISFLYEQLGTLNYADIANLLQHNTTITIVPILGLIFLAMAVKAAIFPLYFWLPVAYPEPSYSAIMLLSSITTKVVMIVMLRLVWLWIPFQYSEFTLVFLLTAGATMFFGVMGAANQFFIKRILSFHIISQLGYILLAIAIPIHLAIIAAIYFIIHNMFVKTNLFMVSGAIWHYYQTDDLHCLGQLSQTHKWLAIMFFISALSLAGFPPLSGFWAKFLVIQSALENHFYISAGVAILVSLFTLYSMIKIWHYVFSEAPEKPYPYGQSKSKLSVYYSIAAIPLLVLPILMGLFPDIVIKQLDSVATQLQSPTNYIQTMLGLS